MSEELFRAVEEGDLDLVRKLVAEDPSCASARNEKGLSAVLAATYRHRQDMVDVLLAAGPELDVFDAAAVGELDRLGQLLDEEPAGATAFAPDGFPPLGLAADFGQPAAVRLLLERGADVNATARNPMQVQPLHAAVAGRNLEAVRALVDAGADPSARQHGGWTPLMAAAAHGDTEIVEVLLAAGADPGAASDERKTATSLAAEEGHRDLSERLQALTR